MAPIVQPYNLFAQQKMAGYPSYQQVPQQNPQPQQQVIPGQVAGETVDEFAQGKFNNGQPAAATPQAKPAAVTTPLPLKPAGTVDNLSGTGFASQGNGQQNPITSTEDLAKAMGYTSPEEENRLRKASVANQRMLAVVDALRHIGNIAHTVNYAPSQQFNSPVMEERQRYLQGKALRDKANQTYISYQQQKAKQDAEAARWEADYKLKAANAASQDAYRKLQADIAKGNAESLKNYRESSVAARNRQIDAGISHQKEMEKQGRQRIGISAQNSRRAEEHRKWIRQNKGAGGGGKGGTLTFRGKNGWYSKNMSANEANAFYNQAFETLANTRLPNGKTVIDKKAVSGSIVPGILGGNKINMQARKEAVDKAIYEHPEAGQLLQQQYEFNFDPRGVQQSAMATTQMPNVNFAPWNNQQMGSYGSTYTPAPYDLEMEGEGEDMFDDDYDFSDISI